MDEGRAWEGWEEVRGGDGRRASACAVAPAPAPVAATRWRALDGDRDAAPVVRPPTARPRDAACQTGRRPRAPPPGCTLAARVTDVQLSAHPLMSAEASLALAAVAAARAARGAATGAAADRARHAAAALCAQREAQGWSLVPVTVLVGSEGGGGGDRRPFAVAAHPVAPPTAAADLRAATKAAARLFRQRLQVQLVAGGRVVARGPAAGVGEDYSIPLACTLTATLPSPPTKVALRLVRVRGRWWWPRARAQRVASVAVSPAASPSAVDALAHRPWKRGAWAGTLGAAVGLEVAV